MDTYVYEVCGSKPDVREILANMMERSRSLKVHEPMVCDEDDDTSLLPRDTSKLGKFLGGCKVADKYITIYEKDVVACKAKLRPYNDSVAKMLFDDSPQGQALFRIIMQRFVIWMRNISNFKIQKFILGMEIIQNTSWIVFIMWTMIIS